LLFQKAIDYAKQFLGQEDALTILAKCQEEIASLEPHPNYPAEYRNWELFYWRHIPQWIMADHKRLKFKKSLDIGCAYGTLSLFCSRVCGCEVYCTDFIDVFISKALIRKYDFNFRVNNIELDPFPWQEKFDLIILTEVLEHFNFYPVPTLQKIISLLSENGRLYLTTPDAASWGKVTKYYSDLSDMPLPGKGHQVIDDHVYVYTKDELFDVLSKAGIKIERFDYSHVNKARNFNLTLAHSN